MENKITHYTFGYGGNLNYHTLCGKEIHSHSEKENADTDPNITSCPECKKTAEWKQDYKDKNDQDPAIKRRIYIESDVLHQSELSRSQREVKSLCDEKEVRYVRRVFSDVLDYAWRDLDKTWEAVKKADEIYSDSSLIPLSGGSYMGAPAIFNGMCERAIKENITGKDVYILNYLKHISWDMIDIPLMKKAFKKNNLFMYNDDDELVKVNPAKIKKDA